MWTRAELKERAKGCLRRYYWAAFLVSLIFSIVSAFSGVSVDSDSMDYFSGGSSAGISGQASWRDGEFYEGEWESDVPILDEFLEDNSLSGNLSLDSAPARLFLSIVTGVVIVMAVVSALIGIFLTPVFEVGRNRFYMESRLAGRSVGVGRILWGFSNGYLKIVGTQFLKGLILFAVIFGSMLPGLILILVGVLGGLGAAGIFGLMLLLCGLFAGGCVGVWLEYGFLMTPYILSENPTMKAKEALSLSRQMMQGHKFNAFVLSLSFIGWEFLGLLLCGIGILFVQPYVDATFAELYAVLREPYRNRLSGYGYEEYNGGQGNGWNQGNNWSQGNTWNQENTWNQGNTWNQNNAQGNNWNSQAGGYGGYNGGQENNWNQGGAQGNSWNQPAEGTGAQTQGQSGFGEANGQEGRDGAVSRSEGGPGRGYYLNGVFYPYTDDEKDQ